MLSDQSFLQQLQQDIATIQATLTTAGSPANEAQTESLVIDPILKSLGYATTDYIKQGFSTTAKNFPDYTLLPNSSHKWILEVKKYGHSLTSSDEVQATNYGFQEATEWAVLTNGRTWYIYNIPLKSQQRRVLQIDNVFTDKNALQLLACLSQQGMLNDELIKAWNLKRVTQLVEAEIKTAGSSLRSQLCQIVKLQINLQINDTVMGDVLTDIMDSSRTHPSAVPVQVRDVQTPVVEVSEDLITIPFYTFGDILADPLLGTKQRPNAIVFGEGQPVSVKSWADAGKAVIEVLGSKYPLPKLPYMSGSKGKNYFLNTTATHSDGSKMRSYREAQVGPATVYIDTHRSVRDLSACIVIFLKAINAPLDAVKISIQPPKQV